jgi:hypothetical protein
MLWAMAPSTVTRSLTLPSSVADAWQAVRAGDWLGDEVDLEICPGAAGRIVEGSVERRVVVSHVVEGAALRLLWWDEADPAVVSDVTVELEADAEGTRVTVTERVAGGAAALISEAMASDLGGAEHSWDRRLQALMGGRLPSPVGC